MAFSAVGVDRKFFTVSRFCSRTCDAATACFCRSAGETRWLCASKSLGTVKSATRTRATRNLTDCRITKCIIELLQKVPARGEVYTVTGCERAMTEVQVQDWTRGP